MGSGNFFHFVRENTHLRDSFCVAAYRVYAGSTRPGQRDRMACIRGELAHTALPDYKEHTRYAKGPEKISPGKR